MTRSAKAALVVGILAVVAGGCASGYDDDGYYHHSYSGDRYYDNDHNSRYWRDHNTSDRVRVCDADGDDCHWEYRH